MDIKLNGLGKIAFIMVIVLMSFLFPSSLLTINANCAEDEDRNLPMTSSDEKPLMDKVYTFTVDDPIQNFDINIHFEWSYYYFITVAIVTPHECDMKISLWDPEGDRYDITHETDMEQDDSRRIAFGVALSGNYTFQFEAILSENLNIHVLIEKKYQCLSDRIESMDVGDTMYYDVLKFKTGTVSEFNITVKSDKYYKFYIERVSPIAKTLRDKRVSMEHVIWDSAQVLFKIYKNITMGYEEYHFGTAVAGLYVIDILIFIEADVECANIAYAVVEKDRIADGIDPNNPEPPPEDNPDPIINDDTLNTTGSSEKYKTPMDYTVVIVMCIGVFVIVPTAVIVYRKKKNDSSI